MFFTPDTFHAFVPEKYEDDCTSPARPADATPAPPTAPPEDAVPPDSNVHKATTAPGEPVEVQASPACVINPAAGVVRFAVQLPLLHSVLAARMQPGVHTEPHTYTARGAPAEMAPPMQTAPAGHS